MNSLKCYVKMQADIIHICNQSIKFYQISEVDRYHNNWNEKN
jgi:hypothetical protein